MTGSRYFMAYEIIPEYNWLGFHPLQINPNTTRGPFFHCSGGVSLEKLSDISRVNRDCLFGGKKIVEPHASCESKAGYLGGAHGAPYLHHERRRTNQRSNEQNTFFLAILCDLFGMVK